MTVRVSKPEFNLREKIAELDKPSGIKGNEILRSETTQDARDLIRADRRRLNFNGSMMINQRGDVTGTTLGGYRALDRYYTQMENSNAGTWSITQSTDVPSGYGFKYSLAYDCTATSSNANRYLMTIYRMEGYDSQVFDYGTPDAKTVTLSFWIKCSKAGNFQVNFENELNPDAGYQTQQTIHTAGQWEKKIVTIPGDTTKAFAWTSAKAMCFDIVYSAFGNYASGTPSAAWSALNNNQRGGHCDMDLFDSTSNYVKITGVQLELGNQATEFEHFSFKEELALCQRYFFNVKGDNNHRSGIPGYANSTTELRACVQFPVPMRASPTVSGTATAMVFDAHNDSASFNCNTLTAGGSLTNDSPHMMVIETTTSGMTNGQAGTLEFRAANGSINFDAEL